MKLTKEKLQELVQTKLKPTIKSPSKMGKNLKDNFKKELSKQSNSQRLKTTPKVKLSETDDSAAMKRSGYNDLGIGKKDKRKDLDPSFKTLTFESLEYIDESDNLKKDENIKEITTSLKTIKRDINENKKIISKKQLIENTLKEDAKFKTVSLSDLDNTWSSEYHTRREGTFPYQKTGNKFIAIPKDITIPTRKDIFYLTEKEAEEINRIGAEIESRQGSIDDFLKSVNESVILKEDKKESSGSVARKLMKKDYQIWKKLGIRSGNDLYPMRGADPSVWEKYQEMVKQMLNSFGFSNRNKISIEIRDYLEDKNYHSLNQAIDLLGYGEGKYGFDSVYFGDEKQIDETTTSSSSGQYSTPSMWAPNKKGWANSKKRWWGENSPNTGGSISKGGIVNVKDNCKGYSNSKTQCNSGDISNLTITEDVKKIIDKLSKEYGKPKEYIEKLIREDFIKKQLNEMWKDRLQNIYSNKEEWLRYDENYGLSQRLGYDDPNQAWEENPLIQGSIDPKDYKKVIQEQDLNKISDKQISEFVKKQLIKEGYLKQTEDNWRGEGCKDYDDSRDICLDKEVNENNKENQQLKEFNVKGDRPIYKQKSTGEIWELEDIGDNYITLINLKDATLIIKVGAEELKNDYVKLGGSNVKENEITGSEEYEQGIDFGSVNKDNIIDYIISFGEREVNQQRLLEVFSYLIKTGMIKELDNTWQQYAKEYINLGALSPEGVLLKGVSKMKGIPAYGLNEKKVIKITEKELKNILKRKLGENYPSGTNGSYSTPGDVEGDMAMMAQDNTIAERKKKYGGTYGVKSFEEGNILKERLKSELNKFKK